MTNGHKWSPRIGHAITAFAAFCVIGPLAITFYQAATAASKPSEYAAKQAQPPRAGVLRGSAVYPFRMEDWGDFAYIFAPKGLAWFKREHKNWQQHYLPVTKNTRVEILEERDLGLALDNDPDMNPQTQKGLRLWSHVRLIDYPGKPEVWAQSFTIAKGEPQVWPESLAAK